MSYLKMGELGEKSDPEETQWRSFRVQMYLYLFFFYFFVIFLTVTRQKAPVLLFRLRILYLFNGAQSLPLSFLRVFST